MDQELDFHQDGYLFLLNNQKDVDVFSKNIELQKTFDIPVELLKPEDISRVLPDTEIRLDDVIAASYCGKDGVSDPAGVTEGFRKNAARLGVEIYTDQEVIGIDVAGGRITGVRTKDHRIATPIVINAAGPHAGMIGKMANVEVPVVPLRRFIWTTKPFDKVHPAGPSSSTSARDSISTGKVEASCSAWAIARKAQVSI